MARDTTLLQIRGRLGIRYLSTVESSSEYKFGTFRFVRVDESTQAGFGSNTGSVALEPPTAFSSRDFNQRWTMAATDGPSAFGSQQSDKAILGSPVTFPIVAPSILARSDSRGKEKKRKENNPAPRKLERRVAWPQPGTTPTLLPTNPHRRSVRRTSTTSCRAWESMGDLFAGCMTDQSSGRTLATRRAFLMKWKGGP